MEDKEKLEVEISVFRRAVEKFETSSAGGLLPDASERHVLSAMRQNTKEDDLWRQELIGAAYTKIDEIDEDWRLLEDQIRLNIVNTSGQLREAADLDRPDVAAISESMSRFADQVCECQLQRGTFWRASPIRKTVEHLRCALRYSDGLPVPENKRRDYQAALDFLGVTEPSAKHSQQDADSTRSELVRQQGTSEARDKTTVDPPGQVPAHDAAAARLESSAAEMGHSPASAGGV